MKNGMIKFFNEEKDFGFIVSEDGTNYFFHNSQNKSMVIPQKGMEVKFEPQKNEKGLFAADVVVLPDFIKSANTGKKFVSFGNDSLKVSNIKSYGINKKTFYHTREKEYSNDFLGKAMLAIDIYCDDTTETYAESRDYLYVTTFQNDNYKYFDGECRFDIQKKKKELDELFGN